MNRKKVLLAGAGSIGRRHLRLMRERGDLLLSVAEPMEESVRRVKDELGNFPFYASFGQALEAENPDIVLIATPHDLHAEQTVTALRHGCHVFCEKPMSHSLEGCAAMLKAAGESDRLLNIGYTYRFHPVLREVKNLCDRGELGNILHFDAMVGTLITLLNSVSRHQEHTPGSLMLDNIHDADMLRFIAGRMPTTVFAYGVKAGELPLSSDPNLLDAVFRFDGGMLAHLHYNYVHLPQNHRMTVTGDKAWVTADFDAAQLRIGRLDQRSVDTVTLPYDRDDVMREQFSHFLAAVDAGGGQMSPPSDAASATLIVEGILRSWREGREVCLSELAP